MRRATGRREDEVDHIGARNYCVDDIIELSE